MYDRRLEKLKKVYSKYNMFDIINRLSNVSYMSFDMPNMKTNGFNLDSLHLSHVLNAIKYSRCNLASTKEFDDDAYARISDALSEYRMALLSDNKDDEIGFDNFELLAQDFLDNEVENDTLFNITRQLYIANELDEYITDNNKIDFKNLFKSNLNINLDDVFKLSIIMENFCYESIGRTWFDKQDLLNDKTFAKYADFIIDFVDKKSIDLYDYDFINAIDSNRIFDKYPFFKNKDKYKVVNYKCVLHMLSSIIYDTCKIEYKDDNDFTRRYGEYFEHYVYEYINSCVLKTCIDKLDTHSHISRPDFKVVMGDYVLFVEVKSTLKSDEAKSSDSYNAKYELKKYINSLNKAISQLNAEQYDGNLKRINIVLTNQNIIGDSIYQYLNINNNYTYIMSIYTFEALMQTYKLDKKEFDKWIVYLRNKYDSVKNNPDIPFIRNNIDVPKISFLGKYLKKYINKIIDTCKTLNIDWQGLEKDLSAYCK